MTEEAAALLETARAAGLFVAWISGNGYTIHAPRDNDFMLPVITIYIDDSKSIAKGLAVVSKWISQNLAEAAARET